MRDWAGSTIALYILFSLEMSWLGKMAKSLFYFILLSFLFLFRLTTQGKNTGKYHITILYVIVIYQDITKSYHIMVLHNGVIW